MVVVVVVMMFKTTFDERKFMKFMNLKKKIHFKLKSSLQNLVAIIMVCPMDYIFQTWEFRKEKEKKREYFALTTFYFYCHFPQKSKAINNIFSCAIRKAGWLAG